MKPISNKTKHLTFSLTFIIAVFAFTNSALASSSQIMHGCVDGWGNSTGNIIADVTTSQDGPFPLNSGRILTATGQITSTCPQSRTVNLTFQNNGVTPVTNIAGNLIADTSLAPGNTFPVVPNSLSYSVPNPVGTYNAHFVLGVNEPNIISGSIAYSCQNYYTYHSWPTPIDYHQGEGRLTFNLNRPTSAPVTIRMAACLDNPNLQPDSGFYADTCFGTPLIPSIPSGYIGGTWGESQQNPGYLFTIPQGVTTYTTPSTLNTADGSNHFPCFVKPSNHPRKVEEAHTSRLLHLYLKDESPSSSIFQFSGQSYQYQFTLPVSINIMQL